MTNHVLTIADLDVDQIDAALQSLTAAEERAIASAYGEVKFRLDPVSEPSVQPIRRRAPVHVVGAEPLHRRGLGPGCAPGATLDPEGWTCVLGCPALAAEIRATCEHTPALRQV